MAEGEIPDGGPGPDQPGVPPREGGGRRGEGDLLAERRARRAVESGEPALSRRAEAAEATVRTLEAHVASLQRRLREAEQAREGAPEPPAERPASEGGPERARRSDAQDPAEQELRRARQREYAEQRQRLEAEDRLAELERENGTELERLRRRLSDSESEAGMLAGRLQQLRRELAEAEQTLAAERAALRDVEASLRESVAAL
jgi:chromosome segregation ATPase